MTAAPNAFAAKRYGLDVIAPTVGEAVLCAGGWMFDQAMSGWRVTVWLPGCVDSTPLRILGVQAATLDGTPVGPDATSADASERCTDIHRDGEKMCRLLDDGLHRGGELVPWPCDPHPNVALNTRHVHHRLTRAARAFKAESLRALKSARRPDSVECFRFLPYAPDAQSIDFTQSPIRLQQCSDRCCSPLTRPPDSAGLRRLGQDPPAGLLH